jgi:hypothetical protein
MGLKSVTAQRSKKDRCPRPKDEHHFPYPKEDPQADGDNEKGYGIRMSIIAVARVKEETVLDWLRAAAKHAEESEEFPLHLGDDFDECFERHKTP